ncbi:MAG: signal protein [Myxococcaceae bacterium]|nr:signal protein [Myxococcaceae bacterium]
MSTQAAAPAATPYQRKLKNLLLDSRFQLKFAVYFTIPTLIISGVLGFFIANTTGNLFRQMNQAVEARSKSAETSKELGTCTLNNELTRGMDDPALMSKLEARSKEIDAAYEAEKASVVQQQKDLVAQQQATLGVLIGLLALFVIIIGLVAIVITHRIVGPLFRIKRMGREVTNGVVRPPEYGLRPGDELKDVFDVFATMVKALRDRTEADLKAVEAALAGDKESLERHRADLVARLEKKG